MGRLPVVYAYDDRGVFFPEARWRPHQIICTEQSDHSDAPGTEHIVKLRGGSVSAAAAVSEVVCNLLLCALEVRTLSAVLVHVSDTLARSCGLAADGQPVQAGLHFGTRQVYFQPGPPNERTWPLLADASEMLRIWAADCWFMNLDRGVYGNVMLESVAGRFRLIAVDQSDCFLGSSRLCDGTCFPVSGGHGPVEYCRFFEQTVLEVGAEPLFDMAQRIRAVVPHIPGIVEAVPTEWWRGLKASPRDVIGCLRERADRIHVILELDKWKGVPDVTRGGRLLL